MATRDDVVEDSDEEDDYRKLPTTWPDVSALSSDEVYFLKRGNKKAVQRYKKYLSEECVLYPMKHYPRGNVLVINNEHFTTRPQRLGTERDSQKITAVFSQLGFNVILHNNLTKNEMKVALLGASKQDYSNHDCFILFILSHGNSGVVYGTDEETLTISFIKGLFSENESLIGKPKLFFIQACQGVQYDKGKTLDNDKQSPVGDMKTKTSSNQTEQSDSPWSEDIKSFDDISEGMETTDGKKIPNGADIFLSTASVDGYTSWRNTESGTWFIQAIAYIFRMFAFKRDLNHMMTLVNNLVSKSETKQHQFKQVPTINSTLTRKFYFLPCMFQPYACLHETCDQEKKQKEMEIKILKAEIEKLRHKCEQKKEKIQLQDEVFKLKVEALAALKVQNSNDKMVIATLEKDLACLQEICDQENKQKEMEITMLKAEIENLTTRCEQKNKELQLQDEVFKLKVEAIAALEVHKSNDKMVIATLETDLAKQKELNDNMKQHCQALEMELKFRDKTIEEQRRPPPWYFIAASIPRIKEEQRRPPLRPFSSATIYRIKYKIAIAFNKDDERDKFSPIKKRNSNEEQRSPPSRYFIAASIPRIKGKKDLPTGSNFMINSPEAIFNRTTDINILMIGKTGSGKSALGNAILGRAIFESQYSLKSVTEKFSQGYGEFKGRLIKVIDGPGLSNSCMNPEDIKIALKAMESTINANLNKRHAVLLVVQFKPEFVPEDREMLDLLKETFDEHFMKSYCILVLTHGDLFERGYRKKGLNFKQWCVQTNGVFSELFNACRKRTVLFNTTTNDQKKQEEQLSELIGIIEG